MPRELTRIAVIREFFGLKPNQTLTDFMAEYKQLNEAEKKELSDLAAVQMGVTIKE